MMAQGWARNLTCVAGTVIIGGLLGASGCCCAGGQGRYEVG